MTNEEIRASCVRASSLANDVEDELLRSYAFAAILTALLSSPKASNLSPESASHAESRMPVQARKSGRRAGLKSRLGDLVDAGFFATQQSVSDIAAELKVSGWTHEGKEISARLIELTRAKRLRRAESPGGLRYSNW